MALATSGLELTVLVAVILGVKVSVSIAEHAVALGFVPVVT